MRVTRFLMLALTICWANCVYADPITVVYDVQVTERRTIASNFLFEPYTQQFTLTMSFEPVYEPSNTSVIRGVPYQNPHSYGAPTFSEVPLPAAAPPSGPTSVFSSGQTSHGAGIFEDVRIIYDVYALAARYETVNAGALSHWRGLTLFSVLQSVDPRPLFVPETFPVHLASGGGLSSNVNFLYEVSTTELAPSGDYMSTIALDGYRGIVSLRDVQAADPVPEPGTILCVSSGLALLIRRRMRSRA